MGQIDFKRKILQTLARFEGLTFERLRQEVLFRSGDYTDLNDQALKAAVTVLMERGHVISQQAWEPHPRGRALVRVERLLLSASTKIRLTRSDHSRPTQLIARLLG